MADDNLDGLMNDHATLTKMRLDLAKTIATGPDTNDAAVKGLIDVQRAIEVIDVAIDELTEELEEAGPTRNRENAGMHRRGPFASEALCCYPTQRPSGWSLDCP